MHFRAEVVAKHYFSYGYGTDMVNVDMVAWIANGASSSQKTMWSTQYHSPKTITPNEYTTTIDSTNSTYTVFSSTRKLNPGTTHAYVIPLD